jgi:hypothetical protein
MKDSRDCRFAPRPAEMPKESQPITFGYGSAFYWNCRFVSLLLTLAFLFNATD